MAVTGWRQQHQDRDAAFGVIVHSMKVAPAGQVYLKFLKRFCSEAERLERRSHANDSRASRLARDSSVSPQGSLFQATRRVVLVSDAPNSDWLRFWLLSISDNVP